MNGSQIVVGVDGADAFAEFQRLVQTALKAGESIESAMKKGSAAFDKLGTTGEVSTRKLERAAKNYEQQLARQNTLVEAGGQKNAAYFEAEAKRRGILTAAVQKQIDAMKALEAAQASANRTAGISAGQHAAAMRMLPAQMTDITVGLATGQSPFMVLMQQGGQLKDMFGGIVPAAKAVGGALVGMVANPAVLATAAVAGLAYKMYDGAEQAREYQKAIILAGDRAGVTADALLAMTHTVGAATGNYGLAKDALLELAKAGAIASGDFERMGTTIVQMSQASGRSVSELVAELTKIKGDPLKAVVELSAKYRTMTGDVYAQVRALQEQGRHMEAVRLVQQQYADESDAMSKRVTENLGYIEKAWRGIKGVAADALADMERWGRADTLGERIADLRKQIAEQEKAAKEIGWSDSRLRENDTYNKRRAELADLMRQLAGQQAQAAIEKDAAAARERSAKAQEWLSKEALSAASDREKHLARLREIEDRRVTALKTATTELAKQDAIQNAAKLVAKENADYAEKQVKALKDATGQAQQYLAKLEEKYGIQGGMLDAIWYMESRRGKNMGTSSAGARGHFQFMPETARQYGIYGQEGDFKASAEAAAQYVSRLLKMFGGDLAKALAAYNWGEGNVQRKGMGAMPSETRNYVATGTRMIRGGMLGKDDIPDTAKLSEYAKYQEQHERTMIALKAQGKAILDGTNESQAKYIALISSPAYEAMPEAEKRKAEAMARAEDAQAARNKSLQDGIAQEARYREMLDMTTESLRQQAEAAEQRRAIEIEGFGRGSQWRDRATAEWQINESYKGQRKRAYDAYAKGQITEGRFNDLSQTIDAANKAALDSDKQFWQEKLALQQNWTKGATEALNNYYDQSRNVADATAQAFSSAFKGMEDALVQFVTTGKLDFKSLANSIIADMARIAIQQSITGPLAGWVGGLFGGGAAGGAAGASWTPVTGSALGNVYNTPDISAFSGQIVSSPTWFGGPGPMRAYATGGNLMGEAGPEAILPLKRGPGGYLGVRAEGGGGTVNITVNVADGGNAQIDPHRLTKAIQATVQREIATARRNGGVLA